MDCIYCLHSKGKQKKNDKVKNIKMKYIKKSPSK